MTYTVPNSLAHIECVEFRQNSPRDHYGRLVLGPLARPRGHAREYISTFNVK